MSSNLIDLSITFSSKILFTTPNILSYINKYEFKKFESAGEEYPGKN